MATTLHIYVSKNCWSCRETRKIADEMRVEYPEVGVKLVERESTPDWPESIIATPAYTLNGKLISLGNPTRERLRDLLSNAVGETPATAR